MMTKSLLKSWEGNISKCIRPGLMSMGPLASCVTTSQASGWYLMYFKISTVTTYNVQQKSSFQFAHQYTLKSVYPWNHWRRRRLLTFFDDSSKISFLLLDIFTGSWKLMLTKSKYEINAEGEQVILYEFCFQTYTSAEFVAWSFYQSSLQKSLQTWLLPLSGDGQIITIAETPIEVTLWDRIS